MSKITAGQAPNTLIPEYIGSAFDAVLEVAGNIEAIKLVAKAIEVPHASETKAGIAEIATQTEVNQKINDNHIVTPKKLGVYAAPKVHIHTAATPTEAGFLEATDKQKLDGIANNANNYTHPTSDGNLHVPATGTASNGYVLKAGATAGAISWGQLTAADVGALSLTWVPNFSDINSKPTTLSGYGIVDAQPLDPDLSAIAALSSTAGLLKKTAVNTWALDTNTYLTGNQSITITGDATGTGSTAISLVLTNSGATAGTYKSVTVDAKGRVTAGTNPTTLAGYGITDAAALSHTHSYLPLTGGILTGNLSVATAGQASIEIGRLDGVASTPFIDFHAGATIVDYDVRAIALSGTGVAGGGTLQVVAGNVMMSKATIENIAGTTISATTFSGALSGNASSASTLKTARAITLAGDVSGNASFNGSSDISISAALANSGVVAGTYKSVTVDAKGRVTGGANPTTLTGYGITDAQPKDNTLTALAGVTTAADKLIYATASDAFTTTTITPFARTLIDDANAAAMRTTLGIDGLPVLTFIGDTPPINPWNGVTWYCTDDGRTYVYYVDTDSSQWVESSPQSPATTDTISGTNANGAYTKFADGTLICWVSTTTSTSATKAITYPMAFISAPVCTVTVEATTPFVATTQSPNVTGISINGWNMSSARVAVVCKVMAVGRWK